MATKVCQLEVYSDSTVVIKEGIGWTPNDSTEACQFDELNNKRISLTELTQLLANKSKIQSVIIPPNCRHIVENKSDAYFTFIIPSFKGVMMFDWKDAPDGLARKLGLTSDSFIDDTAGRSIRQFEIKYPAACIIAKFIVSANQSKGTKEYHFENIWCFAVKNDMEPLDKMQLYSWPFCNMYNTDSVCIGNIQRDYDINNITGITSCIYNGVNNGDLESNWRANVKTSQRDSLPEELKIEGDRSYEFLIRASRSPGFIPQQYWTYKNSYRSFIEGLTGVNFGK